MGDEYEEVSTKCVRCLEIRRKQQSGNGKYLIWNMDFSQDTNKGCKTCDALASSLRSYSRDVCLLNPRDKWEASNIETVPFLAAYFGHEFVPFEERPLLNSGAITFLVSMDDDVPWKKSGWDPREVPTSIDATMMSAYISREMENCDSSHPKCRVEHPPILPTRVIDLRARDKNKVRLHESRGTCGSYIALSYCWGVASGTLTTTSINFSDHLENIPWNTLPVLFHDIISVCWELGIEFLWIDALCIIQGCRSDWEKESAKMAAVYSQSYLTIAASTCASPHDSLFTDRWIYFNICNGVRFPTGTARTTLGSTSVGVKPMLRVAHERYVDRYNHGKHNSPLGQRAWAYQESILSARLLYVDAEELVWRCNTTMSCECGTIKMEHAFTSRSMAIGIDPARMSQYRLLNVWMTWVHEFSGLHLTRESDRLPAIFGLATKLSNSSLGEYRAGIWTDCVAKCLLWHVERRALENGKQSNYISDAPSWSWASVDLSQVQGISYYYGTFYMEVDTNFEVVEFSEIIMGPESSSEAKGAGLKVRGLCTSSILEHLKSDIPGFAGNRSFFHPDTATKPIGNGLLLRLDTMCCLALQLSEENPLVYRRRGLVILNGDDRHQWRERMELREITLI